MLYDAVCHANLQSVIRYLYPIRIREIVENDIRIYLYPQKFTDIRKYLSVVPYPRTSVQDRKVKLATPEDWEETANGIRTRVPTQLLEWNFLTFPDYVRKYILTLSDATTMPLGYF